MLGYLHNIVKIFKWLIANSIPLVIYNLETKFLQRRKCNISIMILSYLSIGHGSDWAILQKKQKEGGWGRG